MKRKKKIVTKLNSNFDNSKNPNCGKTQRLKCWQNSNYNCDNTQLKFGQNSKTQLKTKQKVQRNRIFCWALHQHCFETNKLTVFLDIEALAFLRCDWSNEKFRTLWFCSWSYRWIIGKVVLIFYVYINNLSSSKQKHIL